MCIRDSVYPVFEIYVDKYIDCTVGWEQDRIVNKFIRSGDILDDLRGYYFTAQISYDKIPFEEYTLLARLFDRYVDEIYFVVDRQSYVKYKCYIAEPHVLEDFRGIAYKNFRIKFRSLKRYEHGYDISDNARWGTRSTIFNDRTLYRGLRWYDLMIEQNNKDLTTNNNIFSLSNNLNSHLTSPNPHSALYYTKSEIDIKLGFKQFIYAHQITSVDVSKKYFYFDDEVDIGKIKGFGGKIKKIIWYDDWVTKSMTNVDYQFTEGDEISFVGKWNTSLGWWDLMVLKNRQVWQSITIGSLAGAGNKVFLLVEINEITKQG